MKLSKNKIKHLLKVKNQSQKRLQKKKGGKINKKNKTMRKKKHTNLRHKTLRRMKGGGQQASSMKTTAQEALPAQHDFKFFKAKFIEERRELDTLLNNNFSQLVTKVNAFNLLLSDEDISRLKQIDREKNNDKTKKNDTEFINSISTNNFNTDMTPVAELLKNILSDLMDIVTLFTDFIKNTKKIITNEKEQKYFDTLTKVSERIGTYALAFPGFTNNVNDMINVYNSITETRRDNSTRSKKILEFISKNEKYSFEHMMDGISKYLLPMQLTGELQVTPEVLAIEEAGIKKELDNLENQKNPLTLEEQAEAEDMQKLLNEINAEGEESKEEEEERLDRELAVMREEVGEEAPAQEVLAPAQEVIANEEVLNPAQDQDVLNPAPAETTPEDIAQERQFTADTVQKLALLSNKLEELEQRETALKEDLEIYKNMGEAGRAGAVEQAETVAKLQTNIATIEQEKEDLKREIEAKEQQREAEVQQLGAEVQQREEELRLREEELRLQEEGNAVNDALILNQRNLIQTLTNTIQELRESNITTTAEQTEELNRSREAITGLEERLQLAINVLASTQEKINEFKNRDERAQDIIKNLQDTIALLEQDASMTPENIEEINKLKTNITFLEQKIERQDADIKGIDNISEEIIRNQDRDINQLKTIIQELMLSPIATNASASLTRSNENINQLQEDIRGAVNEFADGYQILDDITEEGQEITNNVQDTIASIEKNPKMTKEQFEELNGYKNKIKALEQKLEEAVADVEEKANTHLEEQQEIIKTLQDTISSLESNPTMTEEQFEDFNKLKNNIKLLEERLKTANEDIEYKEGIIEQLEQGTGPNKGESENTGPNAGPDTGPNAMPDTGPNSGPNVEQTTQKRGLQEFIVRIKYPVPGSDEQVIDVIGDSGTSTESNIMNISNDINEEFPPAYTKYAGGSKKTKRKGNKQKYNKTKSRHNKATSNSRNCFFGKDDFINF